MTLSKIVINGVKHWRSEREDNFFVFSFFFISFKYYLMFGVIILSDIGESFLTENYQSHIGIE